MKAEITAAAAAAAIYGGAYILAVAAGLPLPGIAPTVAIAIVTGVAYWAAMAAAIGAVALTAVALEYAIRCHRKGEDVAAAIGNGAIMIIASIACLIIIAPADGIRAVARRAYEIAPYIIAGLACLIIIAPADGIRAVARRITA